MSSSTDLDRMRGVGEGISADVESFYRDHVDSVYAFVFHRIGGDRVETEDLVQETFLTALRMAGNFDGRSSVATWLCGIAKNKVRERVRSRLRDTLRAVPVLDSEGIRAAVENLESQVIPERVLMQRETRELVGSAMAHLPAHYREALVRKYVDGRSIVEIAESEGRSQKAVESTIQRAKSALARLIKALARTRFRENEP